jgi:glutaredoxin
LSADRELTVLSREWCHLCHDLLDALKPLQDELGFKVTVVDVDAHEALEARWSEWVPVVLDGDTEICHHFLDESAVRAHLRRIG